MSVKYYRLAKDEEPPEEFCAVRDVGGEPSEYVFYVPEGEVAKLRELADSSYTFAFNCYHGVFDQEAFFRLREKYRDSGIEVDE